MYKIIVDFVYDLKSHFEWRVFKDDELVLSGRVYQAGEEVAKRIAQRAIDEIERK